VGFVAGALACEAPWHWGYYSYYNPYYTEVIVVRDTAIDYSRPIVVAAPQTTAASTSSNPSEDENQAIALLNSARDAFAKGDYNTAMTWVNQAIAKKSTLPVLHEFRGLILFATGQYRPAAATIYAVLSVGPGWDWATLSSFYPDQNTYSVQLRALEQYCRENPRLPETRFLLAYHYMSCGHTDAAATEFKEAASLNPKDQLSAQLLAGLVNAKSGTAPEPISAPAASLPVSAAALSGDWGASRADGSVFAFHLGPDGNYSWQFTQQGQTQQFTGTYSVTDSLLILKRNGNPTMIGQVTMSDSTHFTFKLVGGNASDPGITFSKQ
jgi:tetratricopeptide (TPR) repeat protein